MTGKEKIAHEVQKTAKHYGKKITLAEAKKFLTLLHDHEEKLSYYNELYCGDSKLYKYAEKKRDELEPVVLNLVADFIGCPVYINQDPRGFAIRLTLVDFYNVWDGETTGLDW